MATLNAFNNGPAQTSSSSVITSGAMSFDARAHGTPGPTPTAIFGFTPFSDENTTTSKQIATLQAKLNKKLGPEFISQRPGPSGGPKLTYAEGWKIINLANEVFGFNGWSSSVVSLTTDFIDYSEESRKYNVGVTAIVRVTLRDGAYHEDVGYGMLENGRSKAAGLDKVSWVVSSSSGLLLRGSRSAYRCIPFVSFGHAFLHSAKRRLSRTRSKGRYEILEICSETVCTTSHTLKKSSRSKFLRCVLRFRPGVSLIPTSLSGQVRQE